MKTREGVAIVAGLLLGAVVVGALSACSSPAGRDATQHGADTAHMSASEAAAMADGKVSADEYQAGFRRYQSCMKKAGWNVTISDDSGYLIHYAFPAAGEQSDARCYAREFGALDDAWQAENVDRDTTTIGLKKCLANAGITPAKTRAEVDDQLAAAGISEQSCFPH